MGALMQNGLTLKTGPTHMQRYPKPLPERIEKGEIDPSFIKRIGLWSGKIQPKQIAMGYCAPMSASASQQHRLP